MKYDLEGNLMQILNIELEKGEEVFSESGAMSWMSPNMKMDSHIRGGLGSGLGRMITGESLFLVKFTPEDGTGAVAFSPSFPGKVLPLEIDAGKEIICQKGAFLCAESTVEVETIFKRKLGAGLFGGEGFFLQKLSGKGMAFAEIDGEVYERELGKGEMLKIDTGCVAMFEPTVKYDIKKVPGIKNMFFGGEGVYLATLEGPGRVWLQSMPASNLAKTLLQFIPKR
ncbi:TIGR00266 family protein [Candidatus Micrarchaeota archaeon]|nr:TIGR00266 family protein [Candidatus Micrarchaeota archaeon]